MIEITEGPSSVVVRCRRCGQESSHTWPQPTNNMHVTGSSNLTELVVRWFLRQHNSRTDCKKHCKPGDKPGGELRLLQEKQEDPS